MLFLATAKITIFTLCFISVTSFFPFTKTTETVVETTINGIRGVPKYSQDQFEKESFTCDGDTKSFTKSELNDGYCDCFDGSDEPGTAACSFLAFGKTFSCANEGYKIVPISSSRVDDGVCDCCDGSDEGTLIKCKNQCVSAAAREKQMIAKATAAYKIGSVIRANDIKRIEQSQSEILSNVRPLRTAVEQLESTVEKLQQIKSKAELENQKAIDDIHDNTQRNSENLLNLSDMDVPQLAQLLTSLFSVLEMNVKDVKDALGGTYDKERNHHEQDNHLNVDTFARDSEDLHYNDHDHSDPDHDEHNHDDQDAENQESYDEYMKNKLAEEESEENEENSIPPVEITEEIKEESGPNLCALFDHTLDSRLYPLCNHVRWVDGASQEHLTTDPSPEEVLVATSTAVSNGKKLLFQLLKSNKIYTEMQLLLGYHHVQGSYDGVVEFVESHYKEQDPLSCPSSWSTEPHLCTLSEKLDTIYNTLNNLPSVDSRIHNDFMSGEEKLNESKRELEIAESSLSEFEGFSGFEEVLALKDTCFDGKDGKFTYNVCVLDKLTQSDTENSGSGAITLGTYKSIESNKDTGGMTIHFGEGTYCWNFGARTADIFVTCGSENKIISSNEPTTCYYTFEVESPFGCTVQYAQLNGIEH